ncbi:hypothetical protein CHR52_16865 [Mycobacterium tuberculosis]|nr:hypothetical protein CHR52_16865 [Mycobacterium tuberculosis]AVO14563.1 hypothetical protein CHR51_17555 [Mycobacterium tuberculosis]
MAVGVVVGGPAFFGESVVGAAGQGEVGDVGASGAGPGGDVVGLAVVGRCVTAGFGAAAVVGEQHDPLGRGG